MDEEQNMKDRVDEITTTSFTISGCPIKTYKEFIEFCKHNAQVTKIFHVAGRREIKHEECYSIGLGILLQAVKTDAKNQMLFDRVVGLENQFNEVIATTEKPKRTGFGNAPTKERVVTIKDDKNKDEVKKDE